MNFHTRSGIGLSAPGHDGSTERRRHRRPGGWKLTHRLWGTFGIMVVVLFASGLTGIWLVMRIAENVTQVVSIEESLEKALLVLVVLSLGGTLIGGVAVWTMSRGIVGAVGRLVSGARRIGGGDHHHKIDIESTDEFGYLADAFNDMVETLRESEERLHGAVDVLQEGFALYDADDRLVLFNDVYRRNRPEVQDLIKTGIRFEDMVRAYAERGLAAGVSSRKEQEEFIRKRIEKHRNPGPLVRRKMADGRSFIIKESRTPEGGVVLAEFEITEQKQAQEALEEARAGLEAEVEERTRELEQANQAKSEFLATMSHELRTPLNAIIGFSQVLSHQYLGPLGEKKYNEYADDIEASSQHLLTLVNDILDLSAIEAGEQSLTKELVVIKEIFADCSRIIVDSASRNGIKYITEVPPDLPPLYADKRAVKQILLNLLSNAVKFTPEGGEITISATASKKKHTLKVSDTGRGVPAEKLRSLTDPFVRVTDDPYHAQEGTGLGLTIVQELVQLHDGKLDIKSTLGKGTTVTVTLPNGQAG